MDISMYPWPGKATTIYIGVEDMILTEDFYDALGVKDGDFATREAYRRLFVRLLNRALANQGAIAGSGDSTKKVQARVEQAVLSLRDQFPTRIANAFWCIEWRIIGRSEECDQFESVLQLRLRTGEVIDLDTITLAALRSTPAHDLKAKALRVTGELCGAWKVGVASVGQRCTAQAWRLALALDGDQ